MPHEGRERQRSRRRNYAREMEQRREAQPDDEQQGAWPREELERMNEQFAKALAGAVRRGQ
jgi:hypothetical protein